MTLSREAGRWWWEEGDVVDETFRTDGCVFHSAQMGWRQWREGKWQKLSREFVKRIDTETGFLKVGYSVLEVLPEPWPQGMLIDQSELYVDRSDLDDHWWRWDGNTWFSVEASEVPVPEPYVW